MKTLHAAGAIDPRENRSPLSPESIRKLSSMGIIVTADKGIALKSGVSDESLEQAGAKINAPEVGAASADIIIRIAKPRQEEIDVLKPGTLHISFLDPFNDKDLIQKLADKNFSPIASLEIALDDGLKGSFVKLYFNPVIVILSTFSAATIDICCPIFASIVFVPLIQKILE